MPEIAPENTLEYYSIEELKESLTGLGYIELEYITDKCVLVGLIKTTIKYEK
jgi:hypothetical protein